MSRARCLTFQVIGDMSCRISRAMNSSGRQDVSNGNSSQVESTSSYGTFYLQHGMVNHAIVRQMVKKDNASTSHIDGPRVLCAGLWRTGTSSLQIALEQHLAFSPCLHGANLVTSVDALKLFYRCCVEEGVVKRRQWLADWFDHFPTSTDLPGFAFVDDLVDIYPSMRIILNKRSSADAWLKSVKGSLEFYSSTTYLIIGYWDPYLYWHHQIYNGLAHLLQRRFGLSRQELFSTRMYEAHNDWVQNLAKKYNRPLLEYEVSEGWPSLCGFLDIQPPLDKVTGKELDFPRVNDTREMQELRRFLIWKGLRAWALVLVPVVVGLLGVLAWTPY